jgi:hypothetical protein
MTFASGCLFDFCNNTFVHLVCTKLYYFFVTVIMMEDKTSYNLEQLVKEAIELGV